jgi:hypothetical protein
MEVVAQCDLCGRGVPHTQYSNFDMNISYFFQRTHKRFSGNTCLSCMSKTFAQYEILTLLFTWFGIIGTIVGPYYLFVNLLEYLTNLTNFAKRRLTH